VLAPLAEVPGVIVHSLQGGEAARQIDEGALPIVDHHAERHDFAALAGLVANLDLVISVDTITAHLAGALGRPIWALLSFSADWRWLVGRDDSPWYPSMRLFRQMRAGDWTSVVTRVAAELARTALGWDHDVARQSAGARSGR
jgi:ADP-heptose:LPS heptosyltransferase